MGALPQVRAVVSWSKSQDFSPAFHWKKLSSQPPKRRTATGVSDASQPAQHPTLGFTVETAEGQEAVLANAASVEQRLRWLAALREVEFANVLRATSGNAFFLAQLNRRVLAAEEEDGATSGHKNDPLSSSCTVAP